MIKETNYKGVRQNLTQRKGENEYVAELLIDGGPILLGSYVDIKDAAKAVNYHCDEIGIPQLNPDIGSLKPLYRHNKKLRVTKYEGVRQHQNGRYTAVVNWNHIRKFTIAQDLETAEDCAKAINGFYLYIDLPAPFPELGSTRPKKQFVLTKYEGVRRRYGKHGGDYQAFLTHNGDRINLGPTDTAQEACEVINYKCQELGIALKFSQFGCKKPIMLEMTEYEGVYYANPGIKSGPFAVRFSRTGQSNGVPFSFYLQRNLGEYKTKDAACAAINYKCKLQGMQPRFPHVGWMRPYKGVRRDEGYLYEEKLTDAEQIKHGRYDPPKPLKRRSSETVDRETYRDIRKWNRQHKNGKRTKRSDFYVGHVEHGGVCWRVFCTQSRRRVAKHLNCICDRLGRDRKYPKAKSCLAPIHEEWQKRLKEGVLDNLNRPGIEPEVKMHSKFATVFIPQGMPFNWMFSYVKHEGRKHLAGMFKSSREAAVGANQLAIALGTDMPYPDLGIELNRRRAFYGVIRVNDLDCYQADFSFGGKKYDLGQYETAESAAAAVHYQLAEMGVEVPNNLRTIDPSPPNSVLISDIYGKPPEGENVQVYQNVEWRKRRQVWVGTVISDGRSYNVSAQSQLDCVQRLNQKCEELGEKWCNPEAGLPECVAQTLGKEQIGRVDATDDVISQWIREEMERFGKCTRRAVRAKFNCTPKRLQRIMGVIMKSMQQDIAASVRRDAQFGTPTKAVPNPAFEESDDQTEEKATAPAEKQEFVTPNAKTPASRVGKLELADSPAMPALNDSDCQIEIETSAEIISPVPADAPNVWKEVKSSTPDLKSPLSLCSTPCTLMKKTQDDSVEKGFFQSKPLTVLEVSSPDKE